LHLFDLFNLRLVVFMEHGPQTCIQFCRIHCIYLRIQNHASRTAHVMAIFIADYSDAFQRLQHMWQVPISHLLV